MEESKAIAIETHTFQYRVLQFLKKSEFQKAFIGVVVTLLFGGLVTLSAFIWNNSAPAKVQKQIDLIEAKSTAAVEKMIVFDKFKDVTEAKQITRDAWEIRMENKIDKLIDKLIK